MTILTRFLVTLLVAATFIGCSDSPTNSDDEPRRIGNWIIEDPDNAHWDPQNDKSKSYATLATDTVVVKSTKDRGLEIFQTEQDKQYEKAHFQLHYTDSTVSKAFEDSVDLVENKYSFPNAENTSRSIFQIGSRGMSVTNDYVEIRFGIFFQCEEEINNTDVLELHTFRPDGTHYRTWRFDTEGFEQTVFNVAC